MIGDVLADNGYEPRLGAGCITLANCPYGRLAETHTTLVCGMNLDLVRGFIDGLESTEDASARLAPAAGRCCVVVDVPPV